MPPRKKTKKAASPADRDATESAAQVAGPSGTSTTTRRTLRGRRGGLKDMPNMPLDILMEIFAHMHPRDLLSLARTSKPFRAFLMTRTARPLWKQSLDRVEGLPQCPSYMSEPEYVNLLFFSHCHNCLKKNVQAVYFELRARYCPACRQQMFVDMREMIPLFKEVYTLDPEFQYFLPSSTESSNARRRLWHKPDVDKFRTRWNSLETDEAKKELLAEYTAKMAEVREAVHEYTIWKETAKSVRSAELDQIRKDRVAAIKDRLREGDWEEELNYMLDHDFRLLEWEKFASKAEPLTERGWQKIQPAVNEFMERIKARRLRSQRKTELQSHFAAFEAAYNKYRPPTVKRDRETDINPHVMDLAVMDEFRVILDVEAGADLSVLEDEEEMRARFDAAIPHWREERKAELSAIVRKGIDVPPNVDPLALACAIFECNFCRRENMQYPEVVAHVCARSFIRHNDPVFVEAAQTHLAPRTCRSPWSSMTLELSANALREFPLILKACGLDPERTTRQQVDGSQAWLTCISCSPGVDISFLEKKKVVHYLSINAYNPWTALDHSLLKNTWVRKSDTHIWERFSKEEEKAIAKCADDIQAKIGWGRALRGCAYCPYIARKHGMLRHLTVKHEIEGADDTIDDHSYIHYDAEPRKPSVHLHRYKDGKVKVDLGPTFNAAFPFDFDSDLDDDYDSDDDDFMHDFEAFDFGFGFGFGF